MCFFSTTNIQFILIIRVKNHPFHFFQTSAIVPRTIFNIKIIILIRYLRICFSYKRSYQHLFLIDKNFFCLSIGNLFTPIIQNTYFNISIISLCWNETIQIMIFDSNHACCLSTNRHFYF